MARPVKYEPHIIPICLPHKGREVEAGTEAMVAGWGAIKQVLNIHYFWVENVNSMVLIVYRTSKTTIGRILAMTFL